jgi:hypothetical protein
MLRKTTLLALGVLLCAGCAGRPPTQVAAIVQPTDQQNDCLALSAEISSNTQRVDQLAGEQSDKRTQNIVAGTVGAILFWPALFAMDFQDAAGMESNALQARQQYLAKLATQRCNSRIAPAGDTCIAHRQPASPQMRHGPPESRHGRAPGLPTVYQIFDGYYQAGGPGPRPSLRHGGLCFGRPAIFPNLAPLSSPLGGAFSLAQAR